MPPDMTELEKYEFFCFLAVQACCILELRAEKDSSSHLSLSPQNTTMGAE